MGRVLSPVARGVRRGWLAVWERDSGDAKAAGPVGWVSSGVALGFWRGERRGAAGDFPKGMVCRDNFRSIDGGREWRSGCGARGAFRARGAGGETAIA